MLEVVHSNPKDFQFSEVEISNFTMHKTERSGSGSNILHPLNLVDPVVVLNFGMHNLRTQPHFQLPITISTQASVKIFIY